MLETHPQREDLGTLSNKPQDQRIRIGYFSGDFVHHPVSFLMVDAMERHDHQKFEVYGFSYRRGGDDDKNMRDRISSSCDHFIDIGDESDRDVALLARNFKLDIAIDLGGLTSHNRPGVFAYRVAPIQISYIGYLGTMGAPYYDYLIADKTIIPTEALDFYSEKIIYLPSYQANDSHRKISEKIFTRKELGLPEAGFIYCCFNNNYKITPSIFDSFISTFQNYHIFSILSQ
jgi:predicted O-linked N-acetylglucosamine transferase (SPINDLY family)